MYRRVVTAIYWPEEVGEVMVYGMLSVKLKQVNCHSDVVERKMEVTIVEETVHQSTSSLSL